MGDGGRKQTFQTWLVFIDVPHLVTIKLRDNIESFLDSFGNGARLGRQCHHKQVRIWREKLLRLLLLKVFKVVSHEKVSYRAKHSWCKLDWRVVFIGLFKEFLFWAIVTIIHKKIYPNLSINHIWKNKFQSYFYKFC